MSENDVYIHVGSQVQGQTTPWRHVFFFKSKHLQKVSHLLRVFPLNNFVTVQGSSPLQTRRRPNLTHKIGQGHTRAFNYLNFVELEYPMLHGKFQDHRTPCSGEEDYHTRVIQ